MHVLSWYILQLLQGLFHIRNIVFCSYCNTCQIELNTSGYGAVTHQYLILHYTCLRWYSAWLSSCLCVFACMCVHCRQTPIPHVNQRAGSFYLCNAVENNIVFAEHYNINILTEFISFLLFILIHPEMLLQLRYMAAWSMALSTVRRYWTLFCDEMGTGPRWPFSNIWAAAAKASQEGICHQCPPSVRLPANQVISLLFLAGMAQKHRLSFQYGSAQRKTDTDTHTHTQQQNTHTHTHHLRKLYWCTLSSLFNR